MRQELRRLFGGVFVYGLGEVLNRTIGFLLLPLFTSYLSPKDFGISGILGLIVFLVIPVFSLGFGTAFGAVYFESSDRRRKDAMVWTAFAALFASTIIMGVSGWTTRDWLSVSAFGEPGFERLIVLSLLTAGCTILAMPFRLRLQFEERAKLYVSISAVSTFLSILSSVTMVVVLERGILGFVEGGLIGQAITFVLFFASVLPSTRICFDSSLISRLMKIGVATIPGFAFLFVLQQGNRYVLRHFDGLDAVGVYTIGYNLGFAMNILITGFTSAWTPYFLSFTERKEEARPLFSSIFSYYVLGFGFLSLFFYLAARPVVMLMTQQAFHGAFVVVGMTATAQFFIGVFSLSLAPVYFAKEVAKVTFVQGVAAVVGAGIMVALIRAAGIFGAGISLVFGFFLLAWLQHLWNKWRGEKYLRVEYDWERVARFGIFYVVVAMASLIPRNLQLTTEIVIAAAATCALSVIFWFGFVRNEERRAALSSFRGLFSEQPG
ncbi:MAG: Polysacc synt C domain-containing protein [Bacteroidetes bacterium]|nr:Polysacc synt C domain-containing protein [Bacteroidota bacterium]